MYYLSILTTVRHDGRIFFIHWLTTMRENLAQMSEKLGNLELDLLGTCACGSAD